MFPVWAPATRGKERERESAVACGGGKWPGHEANGTRSGGALDGACSCPDSPPKGGGVSVCERESQHIHSAGAAWARGLGGQG